MMGAEQSKQNIYKEWSTPIKTDDDAIFKELLDVVFDQHTQWPVSLEGFVNATCETARSPVDIAVMLFYLVNKVGLMGVELFNTTNGETIGLSQRAIDAVRQGDENHWTFLFTLKAPAITVH